MLAHVKKYIIGKGADCDGNVGINQDAANNIYLMRKSLVVALAIAVALGVEPCLALEGEFARLAFVGDNLGDVQQVWFNDQKAKLNPTMVTSHTIIVD